MTNYTDENFGGGATAGPPKGGAPQNNRSQRGQQLKLGIKMLIILAISLVLLIPQAMILRLIKERNSNSSQAEQEVGQMWSRGQTLTGPVIHIPAYNHEEKKDVYLLPEQLNVNGNITTQKLHRGIYDVSVYNSALSMNGLFKGSVLEEYNIYPSEYDFGKAELMIAVSDLRGLTENVILSIDNKELKMLSGKDPQLGSVISSKVNMQALLSGDSVAYKTKLSLKGSKHLRFLPVGDATSVHLTSDCSTPNFHGNYLPITREVSEKGFDATWKVLAINSSFGDVMSDWRISTLYDTEDGECFGVEMKIPVDQYQQNTRSVKYAYLIILLTFATVFFVEIRQNIRIHPVQYILVGLALLLYYTLLLSFSEHIAFHYAYLIASVMTIVLITLYMAGVLKIKKPALMIGGLLAGIYAFIFILLQMESSALLAGSIGLFCILGLVMYLTNKVKWY